MNSQLILKNASNECAFTAFSALVDVHCSTLSSAGQMV